MPIRTFALTDLINITEGYYVEPSGDILPTVNSLGFGNLIISDNGSWAPVYEDKLASFAYEQVAEIDWTKVPAIPVDALITRFRVSKNQDLSINISTTGRSRASFTGSISHGLPGSGLTGTYPKVTRDNFLLSSIETHDGYSDYVEVDPPQTLAEFIVNYTTQRCSIQHGFAFDNSPDTDPNEVKIWDFSFRFNSGWQFEVTYTGGEFTWYLKAEEIILEPSGIPILSYIEAVQIPDGELPPDDGFVYIEYGSSEEFPAPLELPFVWWILPGLYPDDVPGILQPPEVPPGEGWVPMEPIVMTMDGGVNVGNSLGEGNSALIQFLADPSGIYTIVPGKKNDTLYDRSVEPIDEIDVAIPTPFIKTGFLSN